MPVNSSPGPIPPRNSRVIEVSVMIPNRIIGIDGGMMMPSVPPAQMMPIEKERE